MAKGRRQSRGCEMASRCVTLSSVLGGSEPDLLAGTLAGSVVTSPGSCGHASPHHCEGLWGKGWAADMGWGEGLEVSPHWSASVTLSPSQM